MLNKQLLRTIDLPENVEVLNDDSHLPERVVQFGEGNFLRGFVDWMIHQLNKNGLFNGKVVAIQPTPHGKVVPKLTAQDSLYTVILQGIENGNTVEKYEIISSISRGINPYENWEEVLRLAESPSIEFVFSNTTEAGLTYQDEPYSRQKSPSSFPGKLTGFLYHRFLTFNGDPKSGLTIIPCELVESNGDLLEEYVLKHSREWNLGQDFMEWVMEHNEFCNTLVDRIVPGYPQKNALHFQQKLGYKDTLMVVGEPYYFFAIDGSKEAAEKLPFHKIGLNVKWGDVTPYRQLKVSLLNAPHTCLFSVGYLSGLDTVNNVMEDADNQEFVRKLLFDEILPVVEFNEKEKTNFVQSVIERFQNPFVEHFLHDIGLNAVSKFKTRVVLILVNYFEKNAQIPVNVSFSMAALFYYYRPSTILDEEHMIGNRSGVDYKIRDGKEAIRAFAEEWSAYNSHQDLRQFVGKILENEELWEIDLTKINGLDKAVTSHLESIINLGMHKSLTQLHQYTISKVK